MTDKPKINKLASTVHRGIFSLTRHSLALLGMVCFAAALIVASQPAWRSSASHNLLGWLDARQESHLPSSEVALMVPALSPVTHMPLATLSEEQAAVTRWLSTRYKLSPEPLGALVFEAWALGDRIQISPTLLLSVIAIESRFNPFSSGTQGGMGLMQIEPEAQHLALLPFGGPLAAFDPLTNLRVGARHLQKLIEQSASIEAALQLYAINSGQTNGAAYAIRVLAKQQQLETTSRNSKSVEVAQNSRP